MLNGQNKIDGCEQFNGKLPEEGAIVVVHGTKANEGDMIFANSVIVQPSPVKLKRSGELEVSQ